MTKQNLGIFPPTDLVIHDVWTTGGSMSDDGGKSFDELKEEYESGEVDWAEIDDDDFNTDEDGSGGDEDGAEVSDMNDETGIETDQETNFESGLSDTDPSQRGTDFEGLGGELAEDEAFAETDVAGKGTEEEPSSDYREDQVSENPEADYFERMCNNALSRFGFREIALKKGNGRYLSKYKPPSFLKGYTGNVTVSMKYKTENRKMLVKMTSEKGDIDYSGSISVDRYVRKVEKDGNFVLRPTDKRMFLEMSLKKVFDPYIEKAREEMQSDEKEYEFGEGNIDPQVEHQLGGDRF